MKRLIFPLFLLLAACSSAPRQELPPVIDGHTGERLPDAPAGAPDASEPQPMPVPSRPKMSSGGAVVALLGQADSYRQSGDTGNEAATVERALRIEPNNPRLWSRLAAIRLQQGQPQQAEQLALKSNSLATGERELQAQNWRLVARARWSLNDSKGAQAAERKARQLAP
jgi:predicted Zn-dependent protease